jgi:chromate transporter
MAAVSFQLGVDALIDPVTVALAVVAGLLLWRTSLNSAWLVADGAAAGLIAAAAGVGP